MGFVLHSYELKYVDHEPDTWVGHRLLVSHINDGIHLTHQTRKGGVYGLNENGTVRGVHEWEPVSEYELFYDEAEHVVRQLQGFVDDRPPRGLRGRD